MLFKIILPDVIAALVDILSWICLHGRGFFVLAGGIGVLHMPDFYARTHAAGEFDAQWSGHGSIVVQTCWIARLDRGRLMGEPLLREDRSIALYVQWET